MQHGLPAALRDRRCLDAACLPIRTCFCMTHHVWFLFDGCGTLLFGFRQPAKPSPLKIPLAHLMTEGNDIRLQQNPAPTKLKKNY